MEQYIVSARKYRPMTFDTVVGQRALTTTLLNAIRTDKLAHAYLFCGPRGVGKTTCARIFAKTINCEHRTAEGEPCGECESCRAFDEGRSLNIHELDAASNNSVDGIRELIEQVRIPPQTGRYKVFIIDEVHMLSQQAFNAFLKTLEEPPHYVIFILATTEKHKILPTILSRCQVYDFARITVQSTVDHLKYVAEKEGYTVEEEALNLIAQKADGGMRDALSIFDQMVSFTQGNVTYEATRDNLNILDSEYYFRIIDNVLAHDVESSLLLFNEVAGKGFDGGVFIAGLASHLRDLLVSRDEKTYTLLEASEAQRKRYHEQAMKCRPQFLYQAIRLCNDCDLAYRQSRNKRLQVEICLIQVTQANDEEDKPGAGRRPAKILKPLFRQPAARRRGTDPQPAANPQPAAQSAVSPTPAQAAAPKPTSPQPTAQPVAPATPPQAEAPKPTPHPSPRIQTDEDFENALILAWQQFANSLPKEETASAQRMRGTTPHLDEFSIPDGTCKFSITASNPFVEKTMNKMRPRIEGFIMEALQFNNVQMQVELAKSDSPQRYMSRAEQFAQMARDNLAFAKLKEAFALELE